MFLKRIIFGLFMVAGFIGLNNLHDRWLMSQRTVTTIPIKSSAETLMCRSTNCNSSKRPLMSYSQSDEVVLAKNIYYEARGEGLIGEIAVAYVAINRVESPKFPNTLKAVVTQKDGRRCQFSWVCEKHGPPKDWFSWEVSQFVAWTTLNHMAPNPIGDATFYHRVDIDPHRHRMSHAGTEFVAVINHHEFYRLVN